MVRRFICAETLEDALPAIRRLHDEGMRTTVDVLGESVTAEADARAAAARYVTVLDALAANDLDRNVSLKPTQMGLAIDPGLARETIGGIVAKAVELGAFVRIDMEDHTTTDSTLALWRDVRPTTWRDGGADVGLVIQSSLRRSDDDIEAIIAEGGRVRLCKGAYKEPASVAYQDKADVDAAYERQMLRLMRAGRYPAIATHDVQADQARGHRRQGRGDREGRLRVPDAVRRAPGHPGAAGGRRLDGSHLRPVRVAVVPVLHAPPGGATRERVVHPAQPVAGARPGLTARGRAAGGAMAAASRRARTAPRAEELPGIQEPPVGPGGSGLGGGRETDAVYQRLAPSMMNANAAIVPRNMIARCARAFIVVMSCIFL